VGCRSQSQRAHLILFRFLSSRPLVTGRRGCLWTEWCVFQHSALLKLSPPHRPKNYMASSTLGDANEHARKFHLHPVGGAALQDKYASSLLPPETLAYATCCLVEKMRQRLLRCSRLRKSVAPIRRGAETSRFEQGHPRSRCERPGSQRRLTTLPPQLNGSDRRHLKRQLSTSIPCRRACRASH
jgi:hypothetical protein